MLRTSHVQTVPVIRVSRALCAAALFSYGIGPMHVTVGAQERTREQVRERAPLPAAIFMRAADRAALGVTLGAGSTADTAGVRIEDVRADGPAAKAGLKAGDVITDINGVNLKVSREDAEDLALAGMAQRRLQRTLAKAKPGDDVELRVRSGSAQRTVKVKTVSAAELEDGPVRRVMTKRSESNDTRAAVGVTVGGTGNARDTLGLFVSRVVTEGPAEKAGVVEGERIVAVNGVDLRVPKEDLDDAQARSARVDRFVREVQKVAPGGNVTLRVHAGGRTRDVTVKTVQASTLDRGQDFEAIFGDPMGGVMIRTPRGGSGNDAGRARIIINGREMQVDGEAIRESVRESMDELRRSLQRTVRVVRIDA